jgi:hypothetical protein
MVDALSVLLGEDSFDIAKEIGYDGSEIWWPNLPEPFNRRGFHYQDLFNVAIKRGYALMYLERIPLLYPGFDGEPKAADNELLLDHYFNNYLITYQGVAIKNRHAIAWFGGKIDDEIKAFMPLIKL